MRPAGPAPATGRRKKLESAEARLRVRLNKPAEAPSAGRATPEEAIRDLLDTVAQQRPVEEVGRARKRAAAHLPKGRLQHVLQQFDS